MSDPPLSDIDFKNKMTWFWTNLKMIILARESHLIRKYRFQSPANSRWLLPLTPRDASGMNNELTDAVRRLDSLVVRYVLERPPSGLVRMALSINHI